MSLSILEYQTSLRSELTIRARNQLSKTNDEQNAKIKEINALLGKDITHNKSVLDTPSIIYTCAKFLEKRDLATSCCISREWNKQASSKNLWNRILIFDPHARLSNRILALDPNAKSLSKAYYTRRSLESAMDELKERQENTKHRLGDAMWLLGINYMPIALRIILASPSPEYPIDFTRF